MREGRSTLSSCGVGEEYFEYRGWRERRTYRRFRVGVSEKSTECNCGWRERQTCIIENIKPEWTLEARMTKASYSGHVEEGWKIT